jgi:hypothetical protein
MTSRRLITLDELLLSLAVILCALLAYFDQIRLMHRPMLMLFVGLIGSLLFSCLARVRLRLCHSEDYQRLNGATMVAALNRPENRRMLKCMWTLGFIRNEDRMLSGLMLLALLFQIVGYLGLILAFFGIT